VQVQNLRRFCFTKLQSTNPEDNFIYPYFFGSKSIHLRKLSVSIFNGKTPASKITMRAFFILFLSDGFF